MTLGTDADVARLAITLLDLTDLSDEAGPDAAEDLCQRARQTGVAAVCIWPSYVALGAEVLEGTGVRVATVVNFPSGDEPFRDVLEMTSLAIADGAHEIDVVLPYHAWLHGDVDSAGDVLDGVRDLVSEGSAGAGVVKVIIETGELPDPAAISAATHFAISHGADFVKTSTGKTAVSATPEAVETMLEAIEASGMPVGIKASGGIRRVADARRYLELAERVMGEGWISPDTFRFGASSVLDDLLKTAGDD